MQNSAKTYKNVKMIFLFQKMLNFIIFVYFYFQDHIMPRQTKLLPKRTKWGSS